MDAVSSLFRPSKIIFWVVAYQRFQSICLVSEEKIDIFGGYGKKFRPSESVARKELTPTIFPSNERRGPPEFPGLIGV
jgi:hypothetical protein